jgi:biopolymer transport protein TolR
MSFGRLPAQHRGPGARPMSDINMTPLIDVMLVLLVIFMVAAPLMTAALKLELPKSEAAAAPSGPAPVQLALDAGGQAFWDQQPVDPAALRERLQRLGREQPEAELLLAIDRRLPYGQVAALLDQLQAAGLTRVAFSTTPAASSP